jgi:hypothetical protein
MADATGSRVRIHTEIEGSVSDLLFKDWAWEEWKAKYRTSPPWGKKEFTQLYEAQQRIDTEDLARDAWKLFLASEDPFIKGHSPSGFLFKLSEFVSEAAKQASPKRKYDDHPQSARLNEMARILAEIEMDDSIPESEKRNEAAKRWKEIP